MIHLITGIPGSGKTLLAIELILKNTKSENTRPLYSNIEGLDFSKLNCFPLEDPTEWYLMPDGAIIVIDECQRWFRPRANGSVVPEYISRFETHRHNGHDIILITQSPMLIDSNIRKLVELHQHQVRTWGQSKRTIYEWYGCNDSPQPNNSESTALKTQKRFDSKLFEYYKSASLHTGKKRLPWKPILTCITAIVICIVSAGHFLSSKTAVITEKTPVQEPLPSTTVDRLSFQDITAQSVLELNTDMETLLYRGHQRHGTELTVLLEEPVTGSYFYLSDFTGYRKDGIDVIFYINDYSGEFSYKARDRELLSLLP